DLRVLQDHQRVLLAELQHRVRNILAVIRVMAARTAENAASVEDFVAHFDGRLGALARAQVVLTRAAGAGIDLESLVREELLAQSAADDQVRIAGPTVELGPKTAEVLALALHELATNAVKYGGLSGRQSAVSVTWRVRPRSGEDWLELAWREHGVPL